jgi:Asp-tRNA(Asn)/Glu-tRNA(Gln) amidotransferase A subunit family amidase
MRVRGRRPVGGGRAAEGRGPAPARSPNAPPGTPTVAVPQDLQLDRRFFLQRMGLLTAAVATGSAFIPRNLAAGLPRPARKPVRLPDPRSVQAVQPWQMTLAELAGLLKAGQLSPTELVEAYLDRIDRYDGLLMAFNTVTAAAARAAARTATDAPWAGPLHGMPLALKDNYYTQGVLTTANSYIYANFVPDFDATCWTHLRDAGAILLGKTQMGPLATTRATTPDGHNTTVNPWAPHDPSVSPGGSSSGSACAVAMGLAACSTGTQTGGSITDPSSRQGLTGLKPTMGRCSLHGIVPLTYTRDHPGTLARDAMDAAIMLQVMAGPDPADPRTLGLPPVPDFIAAAEPVRTGSAVRLRWPTTVGVLPGYLEAGRAPTGGGEYGRASRGMSEQERARRRQVAQIRAQAEIAARKAMLSTLESLGARVVELPFPDDWETLTASAFNNVRLPERTEPFMDALRRDVRLFGVSLSPWINGLLLPAPEYLRGQRAKLLLLSRVLDGIFSQCDVVVQTEPYPFDMIGLPLIAFPIGSEDNRGFTLPIAGMLGASPFGEERLLATVAAYQAVTDWHRRRPPEPDLSAAAGTRPAPPPARGRVDIHHVMEHGE